MKQASMTIVAAFLSAPLFLLLGQAGAQTPAKQAPIKWVANVNTPESVFNAKALVKFSDLVKRRSNGQLNIQVHTGGALGYKQTDTLKIVQERAVDMAEIVTPFLTSVIPEVGVWGLPFLITSPNDDYLFLDLFWPLLNEKLADRSARCLYGYTFPMQNFFSNRAINALKDMKGLKLRTYNKITADAISALGGIPVSIDFPELYTALQRRTVDGTLTSASVLIGINGWEVVNHANLVRFSSGGLNCVAVNTQSWAALPDALKVVVLEVAGDIGREIRVTSPLADATAIASLRERRMTIQEVSPALINEMRQLTKPIRAKFLADVPRVAPIIEEYERLRALR